MTTPSTLARSSAPRLSCKYFKRGERYDLMLEGGSTKMKTSHEAIMSGNSLFVNSANGISRYIKIRFNIMIQYKQLDIFHFERSSSVAYHMLVFFAK